MRQKKGFVIVNISKERERAVDAADRFFKVCCLVESGVDGSGKFTTISEIGWIEKEFNEERFMAKVHAEQPFPVSIKILSIQKVIEYKSEKEYLKWKNS